MLSATGQRFDEAHASASNYSRTLAARLLIWPHSRTDIFLIRVPRSRAGSRRSSQHVAPRRHPEPLANDAHQDHREVSQLTWNTFRDHLILEYEIPKWDGDLGRPNVYISATKTAMARKVELLLDHFGSQRSKDWFTAEIFMALAHLRGNECRAPEGLAEAFHVRKLALQSMDWPRRSGRAARALHGRHRTRSWCSSLRSRANARAAPILGIIRPGPTPRLLGSVEGASRTPSQSDEAERLCRAVGTERRDGDCFADGSKISFEQTIVANATGFKVSSRGLSRGLQYTGDILKIGELRMLRTSCVTPLTKVHEALSEPVQDGRWSALFLHHPNQLGAFRGSQRHRQDRPVP